MRTQTAPLPTAMKAGGTTCRAGVATKGARERQPQPQSNLLARPHFHNLPLSSSSPGPRLRPLFAFSILFGSFSKPPFPLFLSYQNASHFCGRDSSRSSRRVVATDLRLRKLLPCDQAHPNQATDLALQWTTTWDRQSSLGYKNAGQSPVNFVATAGSADADITVDDSQVFQQMTAGFGGSLSKRDCVATALCQTHGVASRLECYGPEQHEGHCGCLDALIQVG
jgi:hypothetical protein